MSVVIIVLNSLVSEGTPHMALDMCRRWQEQGVTPVVLLLDAQRDELRPSFMALGIAIETVAFEGTGYRRFLGLALGTRRLVRRTKARRVVSMPFGWHAFIAWGAWSAGAVTIAHVGNHPVGLDASTRRKVRLLVRLGAPFTRALVCCSDYVRDGAIAILAVRPDSALTIYNGVALDVFGQVPRTAERAAAPLVVTMVARLEGHKDQATLIRAAALVRDSGHAIRVQLVGDGSKRAGLEALARDLGMADVVHFMGFRDDVAEILAKTHVFAFSTTSDEGLGIALIEAMVAQVPIVASDVGACRETLDGGACGLLVTPGDAQALADGIAAVVRDPAATTERANAARTRARACFDADTMADRYLALVSA